MRPKSSHLIVGLALAAVMMVALPAAKGTGVSTQEPPTAQVNRAGKGDRLVEPRSIAVKKAPQSIPVERTGKREIMDGCEPSFSPVAMPSMAHISGRCVG
jgi:hypothetical protein